MKLLTEESKNSSNDSILLKNTKISNPTEMAKSFNDFFLLLMGISLV